MEKLTMCRICLVENVIMYEVANKDLQEMYEKLTDVPFVTLDWRPMLACFFCYAKLKQCCQLLKKCLNAEEVFARMLNGDYKQVLYESRRETEFCGGLIESSIEHWSIDDVCQKECGDITEQLPAVCDIKDEIELKEEYLSVVITEEDVEYLGDSYLDQEDSPSHQSESDSVDDVPLMNFKTVVEEEQEVSEKDTRPPVAKKPQLDIRKAKLEDTITDKQKKTGVSDSKMIHSTRNEESKSVTKFREPILSDNIVKPKINNSALNKDEEIIQKSLNKGGTEVIKTVIDTNCRNISNQDYFGCKIFNDKSNKNKNDDLNMHKKICEPYTCDICQRSFNRKSHFNDHIRVHTGEKPYKCGICQLNFTLLSNMNQHIIHTHTGEKPYKCNICQRSFTLSSTFHTHIRIHDEKPHKCDICQRTFNRKVSLKFHYRTHTGEKPYKCDICQRSFNQKRDLKSHHHTHTGEKPYKCDVCQRSFNRKGYLNAHVRVHTGEKPYKCHVCQRSFTSKSSLNSHHFTHR